MGILQTAAYTCSVDGEDITLNLVAQLGLEVTQLLLEHCQCRHDDGLWSQGAARLHIVIEPARSHTFIERFVDTKFDLYSAYTPNTDSIKFGMVNWKSKFLLRKITNIQAEKIPRQPQSVSKDPYLSGFPLGSYGACTSSSSISEYSLFGLGITHQTWQPG